MKYIFWGTPLFAAHILERLLAASLLPQALVCNPDRPHGRKHIVIPPPAKQFVTANNLPIAVLQPERPMDAHDAIRALHPEFFIVAAYGGILPREILALPRHGAIGVHPSLLPAYRGPSPVQAAILAGEQETGITLFRMDEQVDHGAILAARACAIEGTDTTGTLLEKLAHSAGDLLAQTMPRYLEGRITPKPQDEARATYTKKYGTADAYVAPQVLALAEGGDATLTTEILRKIRAFNPEPGAWTMREGKRMKLLSAERQGPRLFLKTVQWEGKKPSLFLQ